MSTTKYWENETPRRANTGVNILEYYPKGGFLNVCKEDWKDKDGRMHHGTTVGMKIGAIKGCPDAIEILKDIVSNL